MSDEVVKPKVVRRKKVVKEDQVVTEVSLPKTPIFPPHLDKLKAKHVIVDGHMWGGINPVTKEEVWLPILTETP